MEKPISQGRAKRIAALEALKEFFRVKGLSTKATHEVILTSAEVLLLRDACSEERQRLLGR